MTQIYVLAHPCPLKQHKSQHEHVTSSQSAAKKSIVRSQNSPGTSPTRKFLARIRVRSLLSLFNSPGTSPVSAFQSKARYSKRRDVATRDNKDQIFEFKIDNHSKVRAHRQGRDIPKFTREASSNGMLPLMSFRSRPK